FLLWGSVAVAGPPPPPDWRPEPPPPAVAPPVVVYGPVAPAVVYQPVVLASPAPPPLPTALRVIYAPFYVAALTIRYGLYYGVVVPLEVFGRTLAYGVEGGVDDPGADKEGH
ncbi:MAG: hypothetical protein ACREBE_20500, partial [bacterium]